MKAAVMKIEGSKAVVINEEGRISYIKNKGYTAGEKLEISSRAESLADKVTDFAKKNMPVIAAAASFLVLLTGGLGFANHHPCSTVTLDINPSLRYSLNIFDKVVDMDSFNDDGSEIVEEIGRSTKGKSLDKAVRLTLDELDRTGYVGENTSVVVTLGSRTESEDKLETEVVGSVDDWNTEKTEAGEAKSIEVETVKVTPEMADMAREKNVSPGKIYIVGKLKDEVLEDAEFDEDEWLDKSVSEIKEATKTVSSGTIADIAVAVPGEKSSVSDAAVNPSSGSEGSEAPEVKTEAKVTVKKNTSGNKKKDKTASGNATLSADKVSDTVSGSAGGGNALSGNEAAVSENAAAAGEGQQLIQPTISSQPVEVPAVPEQTETEVPETIEVLQIDPPDVDSSYLIQTDVEDATCDSVLVEEMR